MEESMHPDPTPALPPSLEDIREQVARLEAAHRAKGLPLSGRIIHVAHHLPVEIVRLAQPNDTDVALTSPITPEFKPEDIVTVESADQKWKIHARQGHTAMVSGIRSLSDTHEQLVVAWTGDILSQPAGKTGQSTPNLGPTNPSSFVLQDNVELHAAPTQSPLMVIGSDFDFKEQREITNELKRFSDTEVEQEGYGKLTYVPVFMPQEISKGHYEGYCKTTLWPLFHYLLWLDSTATVPSPDPSWIAYQKANELFAKRVAEVWKPGDLVFVHDYHLQLVPKLIREFLGQSAHVSFPGPYGTQPPTSAAQSDSASAKSGDHSRDPSEVMIALFVHTPWPSSEIFRCLPKRNEILEGMLGANLVLFQTYSYSRHFISSCIRVCGYESTTNGVDVNGVITVVSHCPIGIDVKRVAHDRDAPGVRPKMDSLRQLYADKKIIVGREKLDAPKGVYNKLQAFEVFLEKYPDWRNKVVLIQVTTPALSESPKLERMVAELVSHINGTYGSLDFTPVHHYHQAIERDEYFALLSVADLALITSLRDGMNTTSMEFIICQDKSNKSPLVLSEFMGTSSSFGEALKINPHDLVGVADAIEKGLSMGEEEKETRHAALYKSVVGHTSHTWAATMVQLLLENVGNEHTAHQTPVLDTALMKSKYASAKKRLMLFDYDGTLTPIVKVPSAAVPTARTRAAIAALAADPKNVVYLISGRDGDFLEEHWGMVKHLGFSAEHGSFVKTREDGEWMNMTEALDMSWMSEVEEIFRYYTERTTGSTIELKKASITWHYRNADPVFGEFQCKQALDLLESSLAPRRPIEVLVGKKNLEVRPLAINKGEIVRRLIYENPDADFIMCAGDDKTDEDMFRALRTVFPPGGPREDEPVLMKPPVGITSVLDPDDAEALPEKEIHIRPDGVFATTVGSAAKKTLAGWHVTGPEEVVDAVEQLLKK
ncbi:Trehalose-phosphatase [Vanrija pseudolonga]|uniref:Trehalose-phosphatase n=1 Tax=Vanrija pseudolonga TaxID=143232 RepID=A0AAF1BJD6_9TREE|nr:Trehalose-phosphatase [Vanrija pseudolonga]